MIWAYRLRHRQKLCIKWRRLRCRRELDMSPCDVTWRQEACSLAANIGEAQLSLRPSHKLMFVSIPMKQNRQKHAQKWAPEVCALSYRWCGDYVLRWVKGQVHDMRWEYNVIRSLVRLLQGLLFMFHCEPNSDKDRYILFILAGTALEQRSQRPRDLLGECGVDSLAYTLLKEERSGRKARASY